LVTGAAGFIGSTLAIRLLERGDEVVGIDNLNDYYDVNLKLARLERLKNYAHFTFIKCDVANRTAMEAVFAEEKFQRVMHLAAQAGVRYSITHPHAYIDANIVGFMNILEGCRHNAVEHLAYASSSSVYGANTSMPFSAHNNVDHPVSLYGNHRRDFTYIDDIVEGVIRVIDNPAQASSNWSGDHPDPSSSIAPYRLYNIGSNNPVHLLTFIETLEKCLGKTAVKNLLPLQLGDVPDTYADVSDLVRDFDYKPATLLEDGIRNFVEWYKDFYRIA
jgi:UDP-glucuronate 4-epimerase